ncbi:MAG TPA: DNA polymerase III subunit delta' [Gammaproteobacteria bacterium]|nr:DNA polymerase III subunit delta' [Gammaproteobacteria bacterium]
MSGDNVPTALPWQRAAWARVCARVRGDQLSHALVFAGLPGIGKRRFAKALAASVLCHSTRSGAACGECASCSRIAAGTHPDLLRLSPEEAGKRIGIEAVREFAAHLLLTSQYRRGRVGIIEPAEAMTLNAANSLLKTLEEPPAGSHIFLVADHLMSLPATIRSRCQIIDPGHPSQEAARAWLHEQGAKEAAEAIAEFTHAPLQALELARNDYVERKQAWARQVVALLEGEDDVVAVSEQWQKENLTLLLAWLYTWALDLLRLHALGADANLYNDGWRQELLRQRARCDIQKTMSLTDAIVDARVQLEGQLNRQSLLENVLITWTATDH